MKLKNENNLPTEVITILEKHTQILVDILGKKLVGVYVHGSVAMGGFNPVQSDIDYLAVISNPLTAKERSRLADSFLEIYGENVPAKGIEMSIVLKKIAGKNFQYPTPFEFHMGTKEQIENQRFQKPQKTDPDLAAHFTHTKRRGVCIYGESIDKVFTKVPKNNHLASISLDSEESFKNIQEKTANQKCVVPQYAILNFCRVLAFIKEDLIPSKIEGAEWALKNLPNKFHPIISAALQEYREPGSSEKVDPLLLKKFATYSITKIREATERTRSNTEQAS